MFFANNGPDANRVLPEQEAATYCGIPGSTWRKLRNKGETPPAIQLSPRRLGYKVSALNEWLADRHTSTINPDDLSNSIVKPFNRPLGELTFGEVAEAKLYYAALSQELDRAFQSQTGLSPA